jgi:hypothetical protein
MTKNRNYNYKDADMLMASNYYQYEPLKKEQFTFGKSIDNLGAARKAAEKADIQAVA